MTPMIVITIEITIATIGRLTKNLGTWGYLVPGWPSAFATGCSVGLSAALFSDGGSHGFATTAEPDLIFCKPSTITFSPDFRPDVMTQSVPMRGPTFTGRISAFPSAP